MSTIKRIRQAVNSNRLRFTEHALIEMENDSLTVKQVRYVLLHGRIFEEQLNEYGRIVYVVRGMVEHDRIEVVCTFALENNLVIITVYRVIPLDEAQEDEEQDYDDDT
jgi:hypothetical protein